MIFWIGVAIATASFVDEPAGCWQKSYPCAMRTGNSPHVTTLVQLQKKTSVLWHDPQSLSLLSGRIVVREKVQIKTPDVDVQVQGAIEVQKDSVGSPITFINTGGSVRGRDLLEIPVGMQNWIGRTDRHGELEQGVPSPVPGAEGSVDQASTLYQTVVQKRSVASDQKRRREEQQQADREAEQQKIKDMFRQRFFRPDQF